ncbi:MAG: Fmu (Sun) domain-containing protein [Chitinophagaceae bacterium]
MSRFYSYLNTSLKIIQDYQAAIPLAAWLKNYYKNQKQIGSNDRKQINQLVYNYYRVYHAFKHKPIEEQILMGIFLCNQTPHPLLANHFPHLQAAIELPLANKLALLELEDSDHFFPLVKHLSKSIHSKAFAQAHLIQPDLFIRIRKQKQQKIQQLFQQQQIAFTQITDTCFALPNATKIDTILELNKDVVVQDYASQQVGEFIKMIPVHTQKPIHVWDCCAASGGKSILVKDILLNIKLTVSDVRQSILHNLQIRFQQAGINYHYAFVANLENPLQQSITPFQFIICDAPCTGSGTWGRTPEQLYFFKKNSIDSYATLQKKIVKNVLPHLAANGYFLFITCSVFEAENEAISTYIQQQFPYLQFIKEQTIIGYTKKADTMYAALFQSTKSDG